MPTEISESSSGTSEGLLDKIEEASKLQITTRTLEQWMKRGLVPYFKIGRTVRFDHAAVLAHLKANCQVGGRR